MNRKARHVIMLLTVIVLSVGLAACSTTPLSSSQKTEQQDEVRDMAKSTLTQLYAQNPGAQEVVRKATGYAVFSDFGFKLLIMGGAKGEGIAVDNASKKETFMKMAELQPGLGIGAEKYKVVFIFQNPAAFNSFVNSGWEAGANAMAAAKTKTQGGALRGAVSISEGVYMYQLTVEGAIVGVSLTGAKFYKDKELN